MQGKIFIDSPNYNRIYLINSDSKIELNQLEEIKFFNTDIVNYDIINNQIEIINSDIIQGRQKIAGKLIIESTTKYGLNKRKIPYYLFKPFDWRYPNFLVASSHKKRENLYLEIKFHKWERKIPYGIIETMIGPASDNNNLFEVILANFNIRKKNIEKIRDIGC